MCQDGLIIVKRSQSASYQLTTTTCLILSAGLSLRYVSLLGFTIQDGSKLLGGEGAPHRTLRLFPDYTSSSVL